MEAEIAPAPAFTFRSLTWMLASIASGWALLLGSTRLGPGSALVLSIGLIVAALSFEEPWKNVLPARLAWRWILGSWFLFGALYLELESCETGFDALPVLLFLVIPALLVQLVTLATLVFRTWRQPMAWIPIALGIAAPFASGALVELKQHFFGHYWTTEEELRQRFVRDRESFAQLEPWLTELVRKQREPTDPYLTERLRAMRLELDVDLLAKEPDVVELIVWRRGIVPEGSARSFAWSPNRELEAVPSFDAGILADRQRMPGSDDHELYVRLEGAWYMHLSHW